MHPFKRLEIWKTVPRAAAQIDELRILFVVGHDSRAERLRNDCAN
jgi:hypothetical protein